MLIVIIVLLILLIAPLLIPVSPLEDTVPPEQLADPDSRFVKVSGLQVHYKIVGQGEPTLVLLHGFGASVFSWREVMEPLAESLASEIGTVIAFDRPAFGLTERPLPSEWVGESPYDAETQVEMGDGEAHPADLCHRRVDPP